MYTRSAWLQESATFETFKNLCCRAFLTLRRHADLIINLFSLVSSPTYLRIIVQFVDNFESLLFELEVSNLKSIIIAYAASINKIGDFYVYWKLSLFSSSLSLYVYMYVFRYIHKNFHFQFFIPPITLTHADALHWYPRADVCGRHWLYSQCTGSGEKRTRCRAEL